MKKVLCVVLSFLMLILPCTACTSKTEFKKTSSMLYFGDTESEDPLRICVDIQTSALDSSEITRAMEDFLSDVRTNIGEQEVIIEYVPFTFMLEDSVERKTAVSRLRVEFLAGAGPDVFIMHYKRNGGAFGPELDTGDVLFKSPQKVMESGLFLPLDDYMENHTQHTEWDSFPQAIMDAGRNAEGQQLIPVAYTLPVIVYPRDEFDYTPNRLLSWDDMLTDTELAPFAADLINCHFSQDKADIYAYNPAEYLEFTLGQTADYETGELLFTEEELLQHVKEILALSPEDTYPLAEENLLGTKTRAYSQPITLLPMYSDDGGVTARVEFYAAVNRNTDKPEEAFKVIDTLLSTETQQGSLIYSTFLCNYYDGTYPMNDALYKKDTLIQMHPNEENHKEFCALREQITGANFDGEISVLLSHLLTNCFAMPEQIEKFVHETYLQMKFRVRE